MHEELSYPLPSTVTFPKAMTLAASTRKLGGPCLLKNIAWSCQHRLEIDGKIQDKTGADLKLLYPSEDRDKFTQVLRSNTPPLDVSSLTFIAGDRQSFWLWDGRRQDFYSLWCWKSFHRFIGILAREAFFYNELLL